MRLENEDGEGVEIKNMKRRKKMKMVLWYAEGACSS